MDAIVIVEGESLTYTKDGESETVVLSKWICDKHYDTLLLKDAFGHIIELEKISASNPISIDSTEYTDPTLARAAIGVNW